ncbi:eukaryotic translation initiation factor 1b isoform X1 [Heliangelus exortis]|uniref:eukaryotic translation initiation factor 1b isoform X1 n=1 Tax=Heliangelus exortis TaxID=472823 RepID=UPI003A8D9FE1
MPGAARANRHFKREKGGCCPLSVEWGGVRGVRGGGEGVLLFAFSPPFTLVSLPPSLSDSFPSLCFCYPSPRFLPSLPTPSPPRSPPPPALRSRRRDPSGPSRGLFPRCSSLSPPSRMSSIQNLQSFDPFADATKGDDLLPAGTEDYIHIRIQQRNGRKTLTTVQGIADDYDKKKLVKAFKKKFACNGTVIEHPEYGEVIQLQGDQRKNICQFLLEIGIVKEEQLKVHGF